MAGDTIIIGNWNDTTPAAAAGADNVKFQKDASSPPNISAHVPRADTAGTKYGTIIYDGSGNADRYLGADGNWHDMPSGSLPDGGTPGQILALSDASPSAPEWIDMPAGSLPNGGTTGQVLAKASDSDGDVDWVDQSGGAPIYTPPVLADFSWVNQSNAGAQQTGDNIYLTNAADTGNNVNLLVRSLGAAPSYAEIAFFHRLRWVNYAGAGLCVRDSSSGKFYFFAYQYDNVCKLTIARWGSPTSFTSLALGNPQTYLSPARFRVEIADLVTDKIIFSVSCDGINWITVFEENVGAFLTPDQVGFAIYRSNANAGTMAMSICSFEQG